MKENSLIHIASPVQHITQDTAFDLTVRGFGQKPAAFELYEDDSESNDYIAGKQTRATLLWYKVGCRVERSGGYTGLSRIKVSKWTNMRAAS